ncbi:PAS domain S-box protein [Halorubrum sp. DTA98]|uniref:PAS domain S-box protein n=1 Tax=Halorubrum sp. DTA98 TaxID=3402163 RepID=UPI003AAB0D95
MTGGTVRSREARQQLYDIVRQDIPFTEKGREALALGAEYLGADNGHLTRIDQETNYWEAEISTDPKDGPFPPGLQLDLGTTYCRRTLESDSQIALHDAPNQGWENDIAFESHGLNCYLGTTLVVDGESYGTVCFVADDPREDPFSNEETMFAELIARLLERELEREQHEATLTRYANLALVLNRVLRHNLRNDMSVIRGYTKLMAEKLDGDTYGETALKNIDGLIELTEKARELDEIVAAEDEREPTEVVSLVEDVVDTARRKYPNATVTLESDQAITTDLFPGFERALWELLENAAKHSGTHPRITVTVETVPNAVEIHIEDNGPGLDEEEAEVLETGAETPLIHGSGLGLWLIHWIVSNHDGKTTAKSSPDGTTMTVSIPRKTAANPQQRLAKLTRARDQYQAAFQESTDTMLIVNDDARVVEANPAAEHVFGVDRKTLLGRHLSEFIPAEVDFDATWSEFQRSGVAHDTIPVTGDDGVTRQVEYSAVTDIVPGEHLVISRDVTDRVERANELRWKTKAMENAPVGITITDPIQPDNPMVYANEQFRELTGYDAEEISGRNCRFLQGAETDPETVETISRAIASEEPVSVRIRNYRKDGTPFWNRVSIAPVKDNDGTLTNFIGFQEDITDQVTRERELTDTTERLEAIIEISPDPIIAVDVDGRIELWNEAAENVFGYETESVVGEQVQDLRLYSEAQEPEFETRFTRVLGGEILRNDEILRYTEDGDRVRLILSAAPIRDVSGTITGVIAVAKDVTDEL